MPRSHIARNVLVMSLLIFAMPMGIAQYPTIGVYTGGVFATCDDPDGPVSWQNGPDSSAQGMCPDSETLDEGYTTLACEINYLGNEICLVATSQGLECSWNVGAASDTTFVTAYYIAGCGVSASGTTFDNHSINGGSKGSVQLLDSVPTTNLRWTGYVNAVEVEQYYSATGSYEQSLLVEWMVEGSYDAGLDLKVVGAGPAPAGWIGQGSVDTHLGTSLSITGWKHMSTTESIQVRERQAGMVGVYNVLVSTSPSVDEIRWSGKTWGCDWLNVVEELHRPREISGYSTFMATTAAHSGEHQVDLQGSLLAKITNRGAYQEVVEGTNGFTAAFFSGVGFQSPILFDVDYDQEWLTNTAYIDIQSEEHDAGGATLQVAMGEVPGGVLVELVQADGLSPQDVATPVAHLGADHLEPGLGLAEIVATAFLADDDLAHGAHFRSSDTPCGSGTLESIEQNWSATGEVNGVGSTATKSKLLGVEVFLDGFIQPDE